MTVRAHDDVAARRPAVTIDGDERLARLQSRPGGTGARVDLCDQQPVLDGEMEDARDLRRQRLHLNPDERVNDLPLFDQLRGDLLDGVDRDCEPDTDVRVTRR